MIWIWGTSRPGQHQSVQLWVLMSWLMRSLSRHCNVFLQPDLCVHFQLWVISHLWFSVWLRPTHKQGGVGPSCRYRRKQRVNSLFVRQQRVTTKTQPEKQTNPTGQTTTGMKTLDGRRGNQQEHCNTSSWQKTESSWTQRHGRQG